MDRGAWRSKVHGVRKSQTWLKWLGMHAPYVGFCQDKLLPQWRVCTFTQPVGRCCSRTWQKRATSASTHLSSLHHHYIEAHWYSLNLLWRVKMVSNLVKLKTSLFSFYDDRNDANCKKTLCSTLSDINFTWLYDLRSNMLIKATMISTVSFSIKRLWSLTINESWSFNKFLLVWNCKTVIMTHTVWMACSTM